MHHFSPPFFTRFRQRRHHSAVLRGVHRLRLLIGKKTPQKTFGLVVSKMHGSSGDDRFRARRLGGHRVRCGQRGQRGHTLTHSPSCLCPRHSTAYPPTPSLQLSLFCSHGWSLGYISLPLSLSRARSLAGGHRVQPISHSTSLCTYLTAHSTYHSTYHTAAMTRLVQRWCQWAPVGKIPANG